MTPSDDERTQALEWLDARNIEALASVSPSTIRAVLEELMEDAERLQPSLDEDRLAGDARAIRFAGHSSLDEAVIAWLTARPSAARLDVASIVLRFFWQQALGPRSVDPMLVSALLDARQQVALTAESDASSLFALVEVLDAPLPPALRERTLDVLVEATRRQHPNPAVLPIVKTTLEKAGRAS